MSTVLLISFKKIVLYFFLVYFLKLNVDRFIREIIAPETPHAKFHDYRWSPFRDSEFI